MKTKKDLIESMVKIGVNKVTLPVKVGLRDTPLDIDLSERINLTEAYAPAVTSSLSATDESASFFKYKCAERATRDGKIPTTEELKGACVKEMNDNHQDLLQCDVQKILKAAGHTSLWTPPYCPWLQPIETFWAHGKNRAASKNRNGAHSRSRLACESHRSPCPPLLRPDDEAVHGRPPRWLVWQRHLPPVGPRGQTDRQRAGRNGRGAHPGTAPREGSAPVRQGKKTEDDWIPSDCCRPSNVAGLVEKAKGEAEAMITKIDGLSGTLADLVMRQSEAGANGTVTHKWVPNPRFVDPSAKLVAPHTRDMSDLIGLPQEICDLTGLSAEVVGRDDIVSEEAGEISGSRDRPDLPVATIDGDDELRVGASPQADENCLGCGGRLPVDSAYAFCRRCE